MKNIVNFLYRIDNLISNWVCQTILFAFNMWGLQRTDSLLSIWIAVGLGCYAYLMCKDISEESSQMEEMTKTYEENGALPFIKGFNYSLFLGPLSLALRWLLSQEE